MTPKSEPEVADDRLFDRLWTTAFREWTTFYGDKSPPYELKPEHMACAFRALADHTVLSDAYEYARGEKFPTNEKFDVAGRYGRYMHHLADIFEERFRDRNS